MSVYLHQAGESDDEDAGEPRLEQRQIAASGRAECEVDRRNESRWRTAGRRGHPSGRRRAGQGAACSSGSPRCSRDATACRTRRFWRASRRASNWARRVWVTASRFRTRACLSATRRPAYSCERRVAIPFDAPDASPFRSFSRWSFRSRRRSAICSSWPLPRPCSATGRFVKSCGVCPDPRTAWELLAAWPDHPEMVGDPTAAVPGV